MAILGMKNEERQRRKKELQDKIVNSFLFGGKE